MSNLAFCYSFTKKIAFALEMVLERPFQKEMKIPSIGGIIFPKQN